MELENMFIIILGILVISFLAYLISQTPKIDYNPTKDSNLLFGEKICQSNNMSLVTIRYGTYKNPVCVCNNTTGKITTFII